MVVLKKKGRQGMLGTHRKREEEIDIVAELLFGCIEIQEPRQQHFLQQLVHMMHVEKQLPGDVTLRTERPPPTRLVVTR